MEEPAFKKAKSEEASCSFLPPCELPGIVRVPAEWIVVESTYPTSYGCNR
jgi:hypothetical protein